MILLVKQASPRSRWGLLPAVGVGKMPPPPKTKNHRIITGQFPVKIVKVLREPTLGTEERSFLGGGTLTSCLDTRKAAQGEKTWWLFHVDGELRLAFATPKCEEADRFFTSNCGEQDMILADVYDQSLYASQGFCVRATKLVRVVIEFESRSDLDGMLHHSYGVKGRQFLKDWYDKGARFFRGPSSAPYAVNNPNGMDVDYINEQEVRPAPRPLDQDEEQEMFGEIQEFSQPIF